MIAMIDLFLVALILAALAFDLKYQRIPNKLTLPTILIGLFYGSFQFGLEGFIGNLQGLLLGIGVFLIPFMFGGMGGGDLKLMGAIGALKGLAFVLEAALFTAIWGGVIALLAITISRRLWILRNFGVGLRLFVMTGGHAGAQVMLPDAKADGEDRLAVPYGVAIFAGTVSAYFMDLKIAG